MTAHNYALVKNKIERLQSQLRLEREFRHECPLEGYEKGRIERMRQERTFLENLLKSEKRETAKLRRAMRTMSTQLQEVQEVCKQLTGDSSKLPEGRWKQ